MSYLRSNPSATLIDAMGMVPDVAAPLHEFAEAAMRGDAPLSAIDRELIAARVSHANGCEFCRDSHGAAVHELGGDPQTVQDVIHAGTPQSRPDLAPLLAYIDKLNAAPSSITQADVDAVLDAGWSEQALTYAILSCGYFNLMNRWVEGLGIPSDDATVRMAGRMLAEQGYQGIASMLKSAA
ncbi:uncharacterized peroxidase-related enzyme [Limimonas halophila]|uniref:Uncharacterized peroxidase-related enzyme n=1 Tax=Limimonas halophila TaxID=1082479 RepID=A0A1G7RGT4_9PROT|nr:carboxymuconolactone decarboxylase family protein [Limimonas halophila]SDG09961.1 uncharacterized peroxidase-related enzyme [Limimonas halophila]